MESNAFSKSQNIPPTVNLSLGASNIYFISLKEAFSVEELFLKPHCLVANKLFWLMCWYNLVYTGCPRRNVPDFGRVFLMLNYTDITQNTYIQS